VQIAQANGRAGFGSWTHDHGVFVAHVTAGTWFVTLAGFDAAALGASFSYSIKLATDTARCAHVTTGGFTEAGDGAGNTGNDVILYDEAAQPVRRVTPGADAPEATGITVAPAASYRLTGSLANNNVADSYMDRDTFAFTTGATTNEISIRLNWPSTTADLDMFIVKEAVIEKLIGAGFDNASREEEFETFAVAPNTTYWLWLGAYDGASLPASYDVTVCGDSVVP
jgi:hypothetical protein